MSRGSMVKAFDEAVFSNPVRAAKADRLPVTADKANDVQDLKAVEAPPHEHGTVHSQRTSGDQTYSLTGHVIGDSPQHLA